MEDWLQPEETPWNDRHGEAIANSEKSCRNVELKARDRDPVQSLALCEALGAEDRGELVQRDTYFNVARSGTQRAFAIRAENLVDRSYSDLILEIG